MAETRGLSAESAQSDAGSSAWRKRVAVVLAVALAAAGMLLLERSPASAASAPHVVHVARQPSVSAASVRALVAPLNSASSQLRGTASLLTQTLPDLDATTAARTVDVASSATQAATLSQQLATAASSRVVDAARANTLAGQLQGALTATQAKAAAASRAPIVFPITFCNFTIQIGPIIIDIPQLHIHIVIGPIFIHFRAPCFLSGRIPTHLPR